MKLSRAAQHYYSQVPFKKGKRTCPVCERTHNYHCSVTVDDSLALCKYRPSEQQAKDGRYVHILTPRGGAANYVVSASTIPSGQVEQIDAGIRHAVYSAMLSHLILTPAHGKALLDERGLSDATIANNLYASVPEEAKGNRLARALHRFFDLRGIPGFYVKDGRWCLNTQYRGFYVPYRDENGRIVGLQIRRDAGREPKYLWLSSKDLSSGTPARACIHFGKPDLARQSGELLITEGALKADRISEFENVATVAVAGVSATNPDNLAARLRKAFPSLRGVVVGFDMDWQDNPDVRAALLRLVRVLKENSLTVTVRTWDRALGKGLDDAIYQAKGAAA
jgi:DNA primase